MVINIKQIGRGNPSNKSKALTLLAVFIFGILLMNLVEAEVFKTNEEIYLSQSCFNNGTYCSGSAVCNITIFSPTNILLANNQEMTNQVSFHNYTIQSANTSEIGEYDYRITCEDSGFNNFGTFDFDANPTGTEFTVSQGILYGFIFLLISVFLYFGLTGVSKAANAVWLIFYICLTYILVYSLTGVIYLISRDFLWATPIIENIIYIVWFVMGVGFLPFVMILSLYILGQEARAALEEGYVKQGYNREEARELSRKNKR